MNDHKKIDEIERLLRELKAGEAETAVTVEEVKGHSTGFWQVGKVFMSLWKKSFLLMILLGLLAIGVTVGGLYFWMNGSTFTEQKTTFLERIQDLNELATAEAYTKVIIERQDNEVFGKSIGVNLPGTKRQLLVIIPGSVKAGVELSRLTEKDMTVNHEKKTATLTLPKAQFLGGAEILFDQVEIFSYEGLFREKANIEEAYELAAEAKTLIVEETKQQGVLETAQKNAEETLQEMFSFAGYEVTIEFKE